MGVLTSLLTGTKRTQVNRVFQRGPKNKLVAVKFLSFQLDATVNESFSKEMDATTNPVEQGVDITDHIILKPEKLTIEGVMSATPISATSEIMGLAGSVAAAAGSALAGPLGGVAGAVGGTLGGKSLAGLLGVAADRTLADFITELSMVADNRLPLEIVTGLRTYKDMVLISYNYARNPTMSGGLTVNLSFQQIRFANSITVRVPLPKVTGATGTQCKQEQTTEAPTDAAQKKSSVLLGKVFQPLGFLK